MVVGPHQGPVGVVVFQEWNTCGSYGNNLLWNNVYVVDPVWTYFDVVFPVPAKDHVINEGAVFVQRSIGPGDDVVVFFIGSQVVDLVGNLVGCPGNAPVWGFQEAVLVDDGVSGHGVDQTDVRAFWRFDWAQTAVVGVVNVPDFVAGPVTGQTTRPQGGHTPLVGQFTQRVVLVHELGKLG